MVDPRPHQKNSDALEFSPKSRKQRTSRFEELAAANRMKDELLLSERRAREEAENANRIRSDSIALLSHDFRDPLQAIVGYTELLERGIHGPVNAAQQQDLERIRESQQRLHGLIDTLLDVATKEDSRSRSTTRESPTAR